MKKIILSLMLLLWAAPLAAAEHATGFVSGGATLHTGWTQGSGKLIATSLQAQRAEKTDPTILKGHTYHYSVTIANWSAGSLQVALGAPKVAASGTTVLSPTLFGAADIADNFATMSGLTTAPVHTPDESADHNSAFRWEESTYAKILADDPLVYNGHPGASHLHIFYCNRGVTGNSTYDSLRKSGDSTCGKPGFPVNRSSYWTPVLMDGAGNVMVPAASKFYYKGVNSSNSACGFPDATHIGYCIGIPNGLRYVWGYSMSTMTGGSTGGMDPSTADAGIYYQCQDPTSTFASPVWERFSGGVRVYDPTPGTERWQTLKAMHDAGCPTNAIIYIAIEGPVCWDGTRLDTPNHHDHVSNGDGVLVTVNYTTLGVAQPSTTVPRCDTAHPYRIPHFNMQFVYNPPPTGTANVRLSSDEQMGTPVDAGTTEHMDYFEGWSPTVKALWQSNCTEQHESCADGQLGEGHKIPTVEALIANAKYNTIPMTRFGYSRLLTGNGTFTGEITALDGGSFFLVSPDGLTADITALSITDVTKSGNHGSITVHGTHP